MKSLSGVDLDGFFVGLPVNPLYDLRKIMTAAALLEGNPNATEEEIRRGLSGLKCRCGTHMSILRAVKLAGARMAAASKA